MQPDNGHFEILCGNGTIIHLVDELRHGAGDGRDGFTGQGFKVVLRGTQVSGFHQTLHVGQA